MSLGRSSTKKTKASLILLFANLDIKESRLMDNKEYQMEQVLDSIEMASNTVGLLKQNNSDVKTMRRKSKMIDNGENSFISRHEESKRNGDDVYCERNTNREMHSCSLELWVCIPEMLMKRALQQESRGCHYNSEVCCSCYDQRNTELTVNSLLARGSHCLKGQQHIVEKKTYQTTFVLLPFDNSLVEHSNVNPRDEEQLSQGSVRKQTGLLKKTSEMTESGTSTVSKITKKLESISIHLKNKLIFDFVIHVSIQKGCICKLYDNNNNNNKGDGENDGDDDNDDDEDDDEDDNENEGVLNKTDDVNNENDDIPEDYCSCDETEVMESDNLEDDNTLRHNGFENNYEENSDKEDSEGNTEFDDDATRSAFLSEDCIDDENQAKYMAYGQNSFASGYYNSELVSDNTEQTENSPPISWQSETDIQPVSNTVSESEDRGDVGESPPLEPFTVPLALKIVTFTTSHLQNCMRALELIRSRIFSNNEEHNFEKSDDENDVHRVQRSASNIDAHRNVEKNVIPQKSESDIDASSIKSASKNKQGRFNDKVFSEPATSRDDKNNSDFNLINDIFSRQMSSKTLQLFNLYESISNETVLNQETSDTVRIFKDNKIVTREIQGKQFRFGRIKKKSGKMNIISKYESEVRATAKQRNIKKISTKKKYLNIKFGKQITSSLNEELDDPVSRITCPECEDNELSLVDQITISCPDMPTNNMSDQEDISTETQILCNIDEKEVTDMENHEYDGEIDDLDKGKNYLHKGNKEESLRVLSPDKSNEDTNHFKTNVNLRNKVKDALNKLESSEQSQETSRTENMSRRSDIQVQEEQKAKQNKSQGYISKRRSPLIIEDGLTFSMSVSKTNQQQNNDDLKKSTPEKDRRSWNKPHMSTKVSTVAVADSKLSARTPEKVNSKLKVSLNQPVKSVRSRTEEVEGPSRKTETGFNHAKLSISTGPQYQGKHNEQTVGGEKHRQVQVSHPSSHEYYASQSRYSPEPSTAGDSVCSSRSTTSHSSLDIYFTSKSNIAKGQVDSVNKMEVKKTKIAHVINDNYYRSNTNRRPRVENMKSSNSRPGHDYVTKSITINVPKCTGCLDSEPGIDRYSSQHSYGPQGDVNHRGEVLSKSRRSSSLNDFKSDTKMRKTISGKTSNISGSSRHTGKNVEKPGVSERDSIIYIRPGTNSRPTSPKDREKTVTLMGNVLISAYQDMINDADDSGDDDVTQRRSCDVNKQMFNNMQSSTAVSREKRREKRDEEFIVNDTNTQNKDDSQNINYASDLFTSYEEHNVVENIIKSKAFDISEHKFMIRKQHNEMSVKIHDQGVHETNEQRTGSESMTVFDGNTPCRNSCSLSKDKNGIKKYNQESDPYLSEKAGMLRQHNEDKARNRIISTQELYRNKSEAARLISDVAKMIDRHNMQYAQRNKEIQPELEASQNELSKCLASQQDNGELKPERTFHHKQCVEQQCSVANIDCDKVMSYEYQDTHNYNRNIDDTSEDVGSDDISQVVDSHTCLGNEEISECTRDENLNRFSRKSDNVTSDLFNLRTEKRNSENFHFNKCFNEFQQFEKIKMDIKNGANEMTECKYVPLSCGFHTRSPPMKRSYQRPQTDHTKVCNACQKRIASVYLNPNSKTAIESTHSKTAIDCTNSTTAIDCTNSTTAIDCTNSKPTTENTHSKTAIDCTNSTTAIDCTNPKTAIDCTRSKTAINCTSSKTATECKQNNDDQEKKTKMVCPNTSQEGDVSVCAQSFSRNSKAIINKSLNKGNYINNKGYMCTKVLNSGTNTISVSKNDQRKMSNSSVGVMSLNMNQCTQIETETEHRNQFSLNNYGAQNRSDSNCSYICSFLKDAGQFQVEQCTLNNNSGSSLRLRRDESSSCHTLDSDDGEINTGYEGYVIHHKSAEAMNQLKHQTILKSVGTQYDKLEGAKTATIQKLSSNELDKEVCYLTPRNSSTNKCGQESGLPSPTSLERPEVEPKCDKSTPTAFRTHKLSTNQAKSEVPRPKKIVTFQEIEVTRKNGKPSKQLADTKDTELKAKHRNKQDKQNRSDFNKCYLNNVNDKNFSKNEINNIIDTRTQLGMDKQSKHMVQEQTRRSPTTSSKVETRYEIERTSNSSFVNRQRKQKPALLNVTSDESSNSLTCSTSCPPQSSDNKEITASQRNKPSRFQYSPSININGSRLENNRKLTQTESERSASQETMKTSGKMFTAGTYKDKCRHEIELLLDKGIPSSVATLNSNEKYVNYTPTYAVGTNRPEFSSRASPKGNLDYQVFVKSKSVETNKKTHVYSPGSVRELSSYGNGGINNVGVIKRCELVSNFDSRQRVSCIPSPVVNSMSRSWMNATMRTKMKSDVTERRSSSPSFVRNCGTRHVEASRSISQDDISHYSQISNNRRCALNQSHVRSKGDYFDYYVSRPCVTSRIPHENWYRGQQYVTNLSRSARQSSNNTNPGDMDQQYGANLSRSARQSSNNKTPGDIDQHLHDDYYSEGYFVPEVDDCDRRNISCNDNPKTTSPLLERFSPEFKNISSRARYNSNELYHANNRSSNITPEDMRNKQSCYRYYNNENETSQIKLKNPMEKQYSPNNHQNKHNDFHSYRNEHMQARRDEFKQSYMQYRARSTSKGNESNMIRSGNQVRNMSGCLKPWKCNKWNERKQSSPQVSYVEIKNQTQDSSPDWSTRNELAHSRDKLIEYSRPDTYGFSIKNNIAPLRSSLQRTTFQRMVDKKWNGMQENSNTGLLTSIMNSLTQSDEEERIDSKDGKIEQGLKIMHKDGSGEGAVHEQTSPRSAACHSDDDKSQRRNKARLTHSPHLSVAGARHLRPDYKQNMNSNAERCVEKFLNNSTTGSNVRKSMQTINSMSNIRNCLGRNCESNTRKSLDRYFGSDISKCLCRNCSDIRKCLGTSHSCIGNSQKNINFESQISKSVENINSEKDKRKSLNDINSEDCINQSMEIINFKHHIKKSPETNVEIDIKNFLENTNSRSLNNVRSPSEKPKNRCANDGMGLWRNEKTSKSVIVIRKKLGKQKHHLLNSTHHPKSTLTCWKNTNPRRSTLQLKTKSTNLPNLSDLVYKNVIRRKYSTKKQSNLPVVDAKTTLLLTVILTLLLPNCCSSYLIKLVQSYKLNFPGESFLKYGLDFPKFMNSFTRNVFLKTVSLLENLSTSSLCKFYKKVLQILTYHCLVFKNRYICFCHKVLVSHMKNGQLNNIL